MKQHSAFTLAELSIVLLVISILIVGIMKGGSLVESSRISAARNYTVNSQVPKIPGLIAWYETSLKESLLGGSMHNGAQITLWNDVNPGSIPNTGITKTNLSGYETSPGVYVTDAIVMEKNGINKLPSLRFNGTSIIHKGSFSTGIPPYNTRFVVFRPIVGTSFSKILVSDQVDYMPVLIEPNRVGLTKSDHSTTAYTGTVTNPIAIVGGNDYIITAIYHGGNSQVLQNSVGTVAGGANLDLLSTGNPTADLVETVSSISVGGTIAHLADSYAYTGLISEVIVYGRALQYNERRDVMKYLSKKYNITVNDI